jgi:hypothetical protein
VANLIVVSVLLGAILGRFFRVWVLIPATAAMVLLVIALSVLSHTGIGLASLECTIVWVVLQIGFASNLLFCFLPGLRTRFAKAAAHSRQTTAIATGSHWHLF